MKNLFKKNTNQKNETHLKNAKRLQSIDITILIDW